MIAHSLCVPKGIFYILFAMWIFASVNAVSKEVVNHYPIIQIIFFRNIGALIPALCFVWYKGGWKSLATSQLSHFISMGIIGLVGYFGLFMSLKLLPLSNAVTLHFSETLFITLLAPFFVQEKVSWRRYFAVFIGFLGVILMMRPTAGQLVNVGALYALLFALCDTFVMLSTRLLTRHNPSSSIAFYYAGMVSLSTCFFLPFFWQTPIGWDWARLFLIGIGGGLGQICVIQAYRYARASVVAPLLFTALLWSALYGFLLWDEIPDPMSLWGTALIISSGLYIIWREQRAC